MKNTRPKIIGLYNSIVVEQISEKINWSEFFLIKPNVPELKKILDSVRHNFLENALLRQNISILGTKCAENIEQYSSCVRTNNACLTLAILVEKLCANSQVDITSILPENLIKYLCQSICRKLNNDEATNETTKKSLIKLIFVISCHKSNIWKNSCLSYLSEDELLFETLSCAFTQPQLYGQDVLECSMKILVALLHYTEEFSMDNGIISRLSIIQDNFVFKSITEFIQSWISSQNAKYEHALVEPASVSSFSNKVFNLFSNDVVSQSRVIVSCQEMHTPLYLNQAVRYNKNFVAAFVAPTCASSQATAAVNFHSSPFSSFLTYCSFTFSDFKSELSKDHAKICLLIVWHICEDSFAQSIVHNQQMFSPVPLYHPGSLKMRASFDQKNTTTTLAICECIFSLLTDFSNYHLMLKFPFEHYHIMLSIVHKILIYQKRIRFRVKHWNSLFDALIKLIDYISRHFVRLGELPSFQLASRALIVINFFITYGDTFLPNTIAYDFLYYEIVRQSEVFSRLNSIAQTAQESVGKGSAIGECSCRLTNQLVNILAIVRHIRPKLQSHSLTDPNAEEVFKIVQESFEDLTLKLYEGMETIERWENVDCQRYLFSLVENTMGRLKVNWTQDNVVS